MRKWDTVQCEKLLNTRYTYIQYFHHKNTSTKFKLPHVYMFRIYLHTELLIMILMSMFILVIM